MTSYEGALEYVQGEIAQISSLPKDPMLKDVLNDILAAEIDPDGIDFLEIQHGRWKGGLMLDRSRHGVHELFHAFAGTLCPKLRELLEVKHLQKDDVLAMAGALVVELAPEFAAAEFGSRKTALSETDYGLLYGAAVLLYQRGVIRIQNNPLKKCQEKWKELAKTPEIRTLHIPIGTLDPLGTCESGRSWQLAPPDRLATKRTRDSNPQGARTE